MITLNLDKGFTPFGEGLEFDIIMFPSGCEPHIKIKPVLSIIEHRRITITTRIKSSDDIIILFLATDALRRMGYDMIDLFIPYLPFARQDRTMVEGEPLSIKVFADLLNIHKYHSVNLFDPHSEVSLAVIDNSSFMTNYRFVKYILNNKTDYLIVSPDAGAYKKIFKLCQEIGYKDEIILCNKIRDVSTGHIINIDIASTDLKGKDVYIIDDICDGGGTFTLLAEKLKMRNCGKINLMISHGIFSKGIEHLMQNGIDHIYTTDSFRDYLNTPLLTQIKLTTIL